MWVNDRATGEFLWAMPFPYDTEHFISRGHRRRDRRRAHQLGAACSTSPARPRLICYWNTRSFWPTAYSPKTNSLYVPYIDHCLDMTRAVPGGDGERRTSGLRARRRSREARRHREDRHAHRRDRAHLRRRAPPATARCSRRPATSCSGATSRRCCARSTPRRARSCGSRSRSARRCRRARSPTPSTASSTWPSSTAKALIGARGLAAAAELTLPEHRGNSINVFALP